MSWRRLTFVQREARGSYQSHGRMPGKTDRIRPTHEHPSESRWPVYRFVGAPGYLCSGVTCFVGGWLVFSRIYVAPDGQRQSRGYALRVGERISVIPLRWQWRHVYGYTDAEILFGRPEVESL